MRSSNKSRSRNKSSSQNNRRGNTGNIVNRVFDSAGPEGKVRGTPQQIIEKYQSLSHDAQMSGDRIASENFAQYAEHYARLLGAAQRETEERREAMEAQRRESEAKDAERQVRQKQQNVAESDEQPVMSGAGLIIDGEDEGRSSLVQTPENTEKKPAKKPAPRKRKPVQKAAPEETQPASSEEQITS